MIFEVVLHSVCVCVCVCVILCTNLVYYALVGGDAVFNCISVSLNFSLSAIFLWTFA
jgi:hypothetical protein